MKNEANKQMEDTTTINSKKLQRLSLDKERKKKKKQHT